jgi:hypothetical protein
VYKAAAFHLFLAALCPTLDAVEATLRYGAPSEPSAHLCFRFDASVGARDPHFWGSSARALRDGAHSAVPVALEGSLGGVLAGGKAAALLRAHPATLALLAQHDACAARTSLLAGCAASNTMRLPCIVCAQAASPGSTFSPARQAGSRTLRQEQALGMRHVHVPVLY